MGPGWRLRIGRRWAVALAGGFAGSSPGGAERAPRARSWPTLGPHGPAALSRCTLLRPPDVRPCLLRPRPLTCWPVSRLSLFFCAFLLFLGLYCRLRFALLLSSPPFALTLFCLLSRCLGLNLLRKMMCLTGLLEGRWRSPTVPARFLIEPQPFPLHSIVVSDEAE